MSDKVFKVNMGNSLTATLKTADTYVDKDIVIEVPPRQEGEMILGEAGTPVAMKGTVSNHAISITPSVQNTTGYIEGGTKTGTPVSVAAADLVSGTLQINYNDTFDVTNYKDINATVPPTVYVTTVTPTSNATTISFTGLPTEPIAWSITPALNLNTSDAIGLTNQSGNRKIVNVWYDGKQVYSTCVYGKGGSTWTSQISTRYSAGTLTLTIANASSGGAFWTGMPYILMAICSNQGVNTEYLGGAVISDPVPDPDFG